MRDMLPNTETGIYANDCEPCFKADRCTYEALALEGQQTSSAVLDLKDLFSQMKDLGQCQYKETVPCHMP